MAKIQSFVLVSKLPAFDVEGVRRCLVVAQDAWNYANDIALRMWAAT